MRVNDLRLDSATVAGLPIHGTIGELRAACPAARLDTVGVGGTSPVALRFDAPGGTIWAIQTQYDAYGDSLHVGEAADLWAAAGDSLRFPDGVRVPARVSDLRAVDSVAVVVVDHGDNGTGSYIVRCKYPNLAVIIDNVWPPFAESDVVPFAQASRGDSTRVWRTEIAGGAADPAVETACKRLQAT